MANGNNGKSKKNKKQWYGSSDSAASAMAWKKIDDLVSYVLTITENHKTFPVRELAKIIQDTAIDLSVTAHLMVTLKLNSVYNYNALISGLDLIHQLLQTLNALFNVAIGIKLPNNAKALNQHMDEAFVAFKHWYDYSRDRSRRFRKDHPTDDGEMWSQKYDLEASNTQFRERRTRLEQLVYDESRAGPRDSDGFLQLISRTPAPEEPSKNAKRKLDRYALFG